MIESFVTKIPAVLFPRSGKVFYAGRNAFSKPSPLYVLGVNPGGDPAQAKSETVESHTNRVLRCFQDDWSAYRDESWKGHAPGTHGMAPRILHLCDRLGMSPGRLPSSNLVFARSRREGDMCQEMQVLADLCWPFHELVIQKLQPKVILCLGKTAGHYVRKKLGANTLHSQFIEANRRKWRSQVFSGQHGPRVIVATHPSIADWCATATDPTSLIRAVLQ